MVEKRNVRRETVGGEPREWQTPGGATIVVPGPSMTFTVFDYTCSKCGREHTARGIIAAILADDPTVCPLDRGPLQ